MMRKVALVVVGLLLVAAGAGYAVIVRPLVTPAKDTPSAEAALATPDLVLLAGLNVKQAVFLERWFLGTPVIRAAHQAPAAAVPDRTLLDHLRAARVDPRRDIDYALYALYPTEGPGLRHAILLVGRFNANPINEYLVRALRATPQRATGVVTHEVTSINPIDCQSTVTWMVTAGPSFILVSDRASHAVLLPRLTGATTAPGDVLAWWRPLARADVLSIGIWNAKDVERAMTHPFLKVSARAFTTAADVFQHFYLGLGAKPLPTSGRLRVVIDAADATRAQETIKGWERVLAQSRSQWAQTVPSIAALFESLALRADGNRSIIEFTVDRTLTSNLQRVINDAVTVMLGGLGLQRTAPEGTARAERIDPNPVVPEKPVPAAALDIYDPKAQFADEVDQIQGPFGFRLGAMRVGAKPDVGLELVVEGFASGLPNVTGDERRARLFVDSVKSTSGQELLRVEECGRERNSQPEAFTDSAARRLRAAKAVRLIPGVDPRTLGSVSGHVELNLPTRIETLSLSRPAAGAVLEKKGTQLTVTKVSGGSVAYQITGARDNVLHVRALNAAGKPLASEGGFSSDFLFGEGVAIQKDYAGVVDRVEVVFAVENQTAQFPFTLTDLSLAGKAGVVARDTTPDFRPYSFQAMRRELRRPDPFELTFDKAQAHFVTKLDFTLRSPTLPNFEKAFTVGRLRLKRLELQDGTRLEAPETVAVLPGTTALTWDAPIRFGSTAKSGALSTSVHLLIDAKTKPDELKALGGVLSIHFPRALRTLRLDDLSPGQRAELGDLAVTVVARGRRSVVLETNRDGHRILYVRLLNKDSQPLAFFGPQIAESPDGAWRFELAPLAAPARAEIIVATDVERKDYPFKFTVPK